MIITEVNTPGPVSVLKPCSHPIKKAVLIPGLDLTSLIRGLKGVRGGRRKITAKIISRGHLLLVYFDEYIYIT